MIQVLGRAFTILEIVSSDPERDWPVGELAERLSINQTTCTNIVRSLFDLGYLESTEGRRGYRLGPMAYNLTRNGPYKRQLIDAARPAVEALVRRIRETALVSVLRRTRKVVLFQVDRDDAYQLRRDFVEHQPPYATATGRLLVAHLSDRELKALVASEGPPGDLWDGIHSVESLKVACDRVRQAGICEAPAVDGRLVGIGVPIMCASECVAALGVFMPMDRYSRERRAEVINQMTRSAEEISRELA